MFECGFFLYLVVMEISKAEIKLINALGKRHGRKKHQAFLVEGVKMLDELVKTKLEVVLIAATSEWHDTHAKDFENHPLRLINNNTLQKLSSFSSSNQVIAVVKKQVDEEISINKEDLILVLDTIQDPGNLGTIIRTADWFGINKIICSKETVDCLSSKVVQSSMGSIFRSKVIYTDLVSFLSPYKETHSFYGSLLAGKNMYDMDLKKSGFIIIGNESKGISEEIQSLISHPIYIPRHRQSEAESLNAAIACSIILAEFSK